MAGKELLLINRDISWLSFNGRVLQEANDPQVPLIERIRFLGIFSSNRDEFFRVRIATIKRMIPLGNKAKKILGEEPEKLLIKIQNIIYQQQENFDDIYQNILKELELHGIFIINEKQLTTEQGVFVRDYFRTQVLPTLVPIMVDYTPVFPPLKDRSIYLFIELKKRGEAKKNKYALIEIPTDKIARFIVLPKDNKYIILLDDVIRYCLDDIFFQFNYDSIESFAIKITRDAELDIEYDVTKSLVKKVAESIKRRKKGQPVRLEVDENILQEMLSFLIKRIKLRKQDEPILGGRYHNFIDFINFPVIGKSDLKYKFPPALPHRDLKPHTSIFKVIREKDILLNFPYQSYHYIIDLLREASIDPRVKSIQITLYRAAKNSNILNALINAIRNGKTVTVVVELQARFDEEANIKWSNRLQEEGARIIYGVQGLKVHTKLFLISRIENGKTIHYAHIGTGNFNEDTARLYCDTSLLTCDKRITNDIVNIFNFYNNNYKTSRYKHLVVSPFFMQKKFLGLIQNEIENVRMGKEAFIFLKMNSLVDQELIEKLYEASSAGVKIRLIIRSICSLVTGIEGMSENIEAISIVDKYLEHGRIFVFHSGGDEKYFISSADWMQRNLEFRSEVAVPVYDKNIQKELKEILEIQWRDNTKARIINKDQDNSYRNGESKNKNRCQDDIYKYLKQQLIQSEILEPVN